ncbi:hypothetical protein NQ315_011176 [Exocentrus adspersus]|uniref:PiggyBac transposable element-derived protein domain-containing protein n=1 Tax=Exocentrus adspersus TaxID=1586481 RepID=A0AAV8VAI4_9CUCU|nr:hypothetical protein NQ315_011176 [Exocentrus adspersus]
MYPVGSQWKDTYCDDIKRLFAILMLMGISHLLKMRIKGNPVDVGKKKLKKCEMYSQQYDKGIRVYKWLDRRPVLMISSVPSHKAELKATGKKRKDEDIIKKPIAVIEYNKAKKGVDISDQMSSYYTSIRKSIKWYKKVFLK